MMLNALNTRLRTHLRACIKVFIACALALTPTAAFAAPLVSSIGTAQATLVFSPDPPQVGTAHATVTLSEASSQQLAATKLSFGTTMPSMGMSGPSGIAKQTAPGHWQFDVVFAMSAPWDVSLRFSGAISGTAVYHLSNVGAPGTSAQASAAGTESGASGGMTMSSSGDPGAWRTATFALALIVIVGLFVVVIRRDRRPLIVGLVLGAAILTLGIAALQARYASPSMDMSANSSVQGQAPTPVTVALVRGAGVDANVFAPGTISPYLTQDIVTRAPGILSKFSIYAGDHVRAGQVIATLDAPDIQSSANAAAADARSLAAAAQAAQIEAQHHAPNGVRIADATVAQSGHDLAAARSDQTAKTEQALYWKNELQRERTLLEQGAVSQQEFEDERAQAAGAAAAEAQARDRVAALEAQLVVVRIKALDAAASVDQMRAQASSAEEAAARGRSSAQAQAALAGYTDVTSPNDAVVVKRLIDPGVYVPIGTPIARIAVIDRLRIQANVAQRDLRSIVVGTPLEARLTDGSVVRGRVTSVSPIADPATHTAAVEAIVENARVNLVPGEYVRVAFHAPNGYRKGGVDVPSAAIVGSRGDAAVWTSVDNAAHRVPVRVVSDDGVTAFVVGALHPDSRVVVEGASTLEEGQPVAEQHL